MEKNATIAACVILSLLLVPLGCIGEEKPSSTPSTTSPQSRIEITDLRVAPKTPKLGDTLIILVDLQNTGDNDETYTLAVSIGIEVRTQEVEVGAKSSTTVEFREVLDTAGEVEIVAGYLKEIISVASTESPTPSPTAPPTPSLTPSSKDAFFYTLQGTFTQITEYTYTITLGCDGMSDVYVNTTFLSSESSYHFSQQITNQTIEYSELPDKTTKQRDSGVRYERAEWTDPPSEILVTRTVECKNTVGYSPFITQSQYPLEGELPAYLDPEPEIQSDDPEIEALAEEIVGDTESAMDAIVKILNWVRYNVQYTCSKDLKVCEGVLFGDAKRTLKYRKGNCVNFANLSIALLRAAGIPAKESGGYVADGEHESAACHAWIAVYLPEKGFIELESAYWMPRSGLVPETILMSQHIQFGTGVGISTARFEERHKSTQEIPSLPKKKTSVSECLDAEEIISILAYVEEDWSEEEYIVSFTADAPPGWKVFFSNETLIISSSTHYHRKEILITVIPSADTQSGDETEIIITADDGTRQGEIVLSLSIC
jgi:hypothetical protein